jgi:cysteine-rich repeat protein
MTASLGPLALTLPKGDVTARLTLFALGTTGEILVDISFFTLRPLFGGSTVYQLDPFIALELTTLCACDAPCDERLEPAAAVVDAGPIPLLGPATYTCLPTCERLCEPGRTGPHCTSLLADRGTGNSSATAAGRCAAAAYSTRGVNATAPALAGNSVVEPGEVCDDGNLLSGDGCDAAMRPELGYRCPARGGVCLDIDECVEGDMSPCALGLACLNLPGTYSCCDAATTDNFTSLPLVPGPGSLDYLSARLSLAARRVRTEGIVELGPGLFVCAPGLRRLLPHGVSADNDTSPVVLSFDARGALTTADDSPADLPVCAPSIVRRVAVTENQVFQLSLPVAGLVDPDVSADTGNSPVSLTYTASTGLLVGAITASRDFEATLTVTGRTLAGLHVERTFKLAFVVAATLRRQPRAVVLSIGKPVDGLTLGGAMGGRAPYAFQLTPQLLPHGLAYRAADGGAVEVFGTPTQLFPAAIYRLFTADANSHAVETDAVSLSVVPSLNVAEGVRELTYQAMATVPFSIQLPKVRRTRRRGSTVCFALARPSLQVHSPCSPHLSPGYRPQQPGPALLCHERRHVQFYGPRQQQLPPRFP